MRTAEQAEAYNKRELQSVVRAFKAMDDEAIKAAKDLSAQLATVAGDAIKSKARTRNKAGEGSRRVAEGLRVSKSSKIGELSIGFASQRFSGGASTLTLWPGLEFGSNRYSQFPSRSPRRGRGAAGYFIYPALREVQPELVRKWEDGFSKIVSKF
jgi:hypothetical protein